MRWPKRLRTVCSLSGCAGVMRLGLGCVFLWSSLPKLRQPYDFLSNVYEYELVGRNLGLAVTMVFPWMELVLGICLLGGILVTGALLGATVLTAIFTFAQASAMYRRLEISCGCFSQTGTDIVSYATLMRSTVLVAAAVFAYLVCCSTKSHVASSTHSRIPAPPPLGETR